MKPESDVVIEITGPGLVVNGAAITALNALRLAGFRVSCQDWAGLNQWPAHLHGDLAQQQADKVTVSLIVNPMPWGG